MEKLFKNFRDSWFNTEWLKEGKNKYTLQHFSISGLNNKKKFLVLKFVSQKDILWIGIELDDLYQGFGLIIKGLHTLLVKTTSKDL